MHDSQIKHKVSVKSMRDQTFQVHGSQVFNVLPSQIRNETGCSIDDFKRKLDKFLERVADEPDVRGLTPEAVTPTVRLLTLS